MAFSGRQARMAGLVSLLGWVTATSREAHQLAQRRRMRTMRLTEAERDTCLDELAEQYAVGRIDKDELDHRVDLLHRAVTRGDLGPVFAGLPAPRLRTPARAVPPGRWRWYVFVLAAWLAAPFLLLGLGFLVAGHTGAGVVIGLPALVWVILVRRWAGRRSPKVVA